MLADEVDESLDSFSLWNVEFDGLLADIEVDLAGGASNIAEVRICHFARAIDDATHDGNTNAFEMPGCCSDLLSGVLEVEKGSAAGWTGDVVGFEDA